MRAALGGRAARPCFSTEPPSSALRRCSRPHPSSSPPAAAAVPEAPPPREPGNRTCDALEIRSFLPGFHVRTAARTPRPVLGGQSESRPLCLPGWRQPTATHAQLARTTSARARRVSRAPVAPWCHPLPPGQSFATPTIVLMSSLGPGNAGGVVVGAHLLATGRGHVLLEAALVLKALLGAARRQLLLLHLVDLRGLVAHLAGAGERAVNLTLRSQAAREEPATEQMRERARSLATAAAVPGGERACPRTRTYHSFPSLLPGGRCGGARCRWSRQAGLRGARPGVQCS